MKIGIIGTGNMGSILLEAFIESNAVVPSELNITNRTIQKAERFTKIYPGIHVKNNGIEVVKHSDLIFICVKPLEIHSLLMGIKSELTPEKCVISITSPIRVEEVEGIVECSVARVIPSITNRALSGATLITFGANCDEKHKEQILGLMEKISVPIEIEENITRVASDITSCAPAFFSYLLQRFTQAATEETEITHEQAVQLASIMLVGMGNLIEKEIFTLPTLQDKVCVKGGVTGEGIKVLDNELGLLFNNIIKSTHAKYSEDREKIQKLFLNSKM